MTFHTYILKCSDNSYYIGHTDELERRIAQHHSRAFPSCYTATRLPVELLFQQEFASREEALASERQIKGWSGKKKEAMIARDWNEVSRLAQNTLRQASFDGAQGERIGENVQVDDQQRRSINASPTTVHADTELSRSVEALATESTK